MKTSYIPLSAYQGGGSKENVSVHAILGPVDI